MGAPPQEEEEPSADQLQALYHRTVVLGNARYVDRAVWGPFGRKTTRANKFRTWIPTSDGSKISKELPLPENFQQWLSSWRVFEAAAIMLDLISMAALALYEKAIERLTRLWPSAWHLVVAADDKCRAEHIERIRRSCEVKRSAGKDVPADYSEKNRALHASGSPLRTPRSGTPAAAWVAAGSRGAPLAPDERVAALHLPSGQPALEPQVDRPRSDRRQQREATKQRRAAVAILAQVFDAQIPLFLRFVVLCSSLRAVCMVGCRWAKRGRRSAAAEEERAARRLRGDGCKRSRNETSCSVQFSSSVGELPLTGSESSPACALAGIGPWVSGPSPWQAEDREVESEISSQSRTI